MALAAWLTTHWLDLLQATGVVGLFFTAITIRADSRERKIQNLIALTAAHREIWSKVYDKPSLANVLSPDADPAAKPASFEERLFVHLLILHLNASFKARKSGMEFDDDAVRADVRQFLSRPIPRSVWETSKEFQSRDFVAFVEGAMEGR